MGDVAKTCPYRGVACVRGACEFWGVARWEVKQSWLDEQSRLERARQKPGWWWRFWHTGARIYFAPEYEPVYGCLAKRGA